MQEQVRGAAWALAMWGVFSVIFGILILAWPEITLKAFLVILGIYFLATGAIMVVGSLVSRRGHWVGGILIGALSAIAGVYTFAHPKISALAILTVIAIWAVVAGSLQIVAGLEGRNNNWWIVLAGAVNALFGLYIFANPKGGAIVIVWLIGLSVILSGLLMTVAAVKSGELSRG